MNVISVFQKVLLNLNNLRPNIYVSKLTDVNFEKLYQKGVRYVVFDRDNTLTVKFQPNFFSKEQESVVIQCQKLFGKQNVGMLSNSEINVVGVEQLGMSLIHTVKRKPNNFQCVVRHFKEYKKPEEVCFVGDRLLTDVLLANINGSVSILVDELDPNSESIQIQIMRKLEKRYLQKISTQPHKVYGNLQDMIKK